jgi:hypothetical protein
MTRALLKLVVLAALVAAGSFTVAYYQSHTALDRQLAEVQDENQKLRDAVDRLTGERRVAELLVTDRQVGPDGVPRTTLLMEEYARDGTPLPPARFTVRGTEAHVDATVIRFDKGLVEQDDPLRGRSIALFTRIFGDRQTPADGAVIDGPNRIGELDRGADPRVTLFERSLWAQFWHLADDPAYRRRMGVAVAGGQGVYFPADFDRLYTVTLQANGGLSVTGEPLKGIYRDALHPPARPPG